MSDFVEIGSEEYYKEASEKKKKSQPINFENTIWQTLDQKPSIGNLYFLDSSLYNSCKFKAERELGYSQEEQALEERENRIIELYEERGGDIERFTFANYQVGASIDHIYDVTFKNRMYQLDVLILTLKIVRFPNTYGLDITYPELTTYMTRSSTLPLFTESYERMTGQVHIGGLKIDTRSILRRNGQYIIKASAAGNGFTTNGFGSPMGIIPFLGGSLPILFVSSDGEEQPLYAFGSISPIEFNNSGEKFENTTNWSLSEELKKYEDGDIEFEKLSLLAEKAVGTIGD